MTRQDIGDFLGLTVETVSRMMTRLAREKAIVIVPDGVRLLDVARLERSRNLTSVFSPFSRRPRPVRIRNRRSPALRLPIPHD